MLQSTGAIYRVCMPASGNWNGDLVVFAHGYVAPQVPLGIPEDQLALPDGTSIPGIVNGLGFAFAVTSYRKNGLAVVEGVFDVVDLVIAFKASHPQTRRVYLVGVSEGGLVTALALEHYTNVFTAGMAICGPIGDFRRQINYWGDFRVLFDYFFSGVLPPSPVKIPDGLIDQWGTLYIPRIETALAANPSATSQLIRVSSAAIDPIDPTSAGKTVLGVLWYNVFATNEGNTELGGQPYDNLQRWYFGSTNDLRLNLDVQRFSADPAALAEIQENYQTSGLLMAPLVTLHNVADPIIPYWQETLFRTKTLTTGSAQLYSNIPILRYGHCNVTSSEALAGFALMVLRGAGLRLAGAESGLSDPKNSIDYLGLAKEHGLIP